MRTMFNIDDDVLAAVRDMANRERVTTGQAVSRLLRRALVGDLVASPKNTVDSPSGFRALPAGDKVVTNEDINRLRDAAGI